MVKLSDRNNTHLIIFLSALSAAAILLVMVSIGIISGVSQQTFELLDNIPNYQTKLSFGADLLRLILALDNVFIACYAATIIFVVKHLWSREQSIVLLLILSASISAALLDYIENHHILALLLATEFSLPISISQVELQMVASTLKWHLAYFAFFLLGCAIQARSNFERLFKWSLVLWQLPIGVAVYPTWGSAIGEVLFYLRYLNLLVGFVFIAVLFRPQSLKVRD